MIGDTVGNNEIPGNNKGPVSLRCMENNEILDNHINLTTI